jgi:hypothetical protein
MEPRPLPLGREGACRLKLFRPDGRWLPVAFRVPGGLGQA